MPSSVSGRTWQYRVITMGRDEDHHDVTTTSALRQGHKLEIEHRGQVESVRVEAIEPSGIGGVDARVSARLIERRRRDSTNPGPEEAIDVSRRDSRVDAEIRA